MVATVVVALLVGLGVVGWRLDLAQEWWGWGVDPQRDPAAVAPPAGLDLPPLLEPSPVALGVGADAAPRVSPPRVAAAVRAAWQGEKPDRITVAVADLAGGPTVLESGPPRFVPASTTKLLTAVAVLDLLGPDTRFSTTVVRTNPADSVPGSGPARIVLVGGGDPYLASEPPPAGSPSATGLSGTALSATADVTTLAASTAAALKRDGVGKVRLGYDASLFTGPGNNPHWPATYLPEGVVAPISALWVDHGIAESGFGRVEDPAATAARKFASALRAAGIKVKAKVRKGKAPAGAPVIASVESAPLSELVERVVDVSDNEGAEVLAHHIGLASTGEGSFAGGAQGTVQVLTELGVDVAGLRLHDGSGLSRTNRFRAQTLIDVLRVAASDQHPDLRAAITGLPVAGFSGSLAARFEDAPAAGLGMVRAKTGTLTGIHGLAGLITDHTGAVMVFVAVANGVPPENALTVRATLDRLAATLAGCACSADATPPQAPTD